jgi:hypothetical protein
MKMGINGISTSNKTRNRRKIILSLTKSRKRMSKEKMTRILSSNTWQRMVRLKI